MVYGLLRVGRMVGCRGTLLEGLPVRCLRINHDLQIAAGGLMCCARPNVTPLGQYGGVHGSRVGQVRCRRRWMTCVLQSGWCFVVGRSNW